MSKKAARREPAVTGVPMVETPGTPAPRAPRLPSPGWLPDPSETALERYWDGARWTSRVRNSYTKVELWSVAEQPGGAQQRFSQQGGSYSSGSHQGGFQTRGVQTRGAYTRGLAQTGSGAAGTGGSRASTWGVGVVALAVVVLAVGWAGLLPSWVPFSDTLAMSEPVGPEVDYPVFGSNDLVLYLARNMVAHEESIDVSHWVLNGSVSLDDLDEAVREAATQNPYIFLSQWQVTPGATQTQLRPFYVYERDEAERRRADTQNAVAAAMAAVAAAGVDTSSSDQLKATAINDFIVANATYDFDALDEIDRGASTMTSLRVAQSQEAYGILVAGTAVCNGYSQAFQLLAEAMDMDSVIVTGMSNGGLYPGLHAWNRVRVDGQWKVIDVTWNDDDSATRSRPYFLLESNDPALATRTVGDGWVMREHRENYASW